jgi:hypothetical protein
LEQAGDSNDHAKNPDKEALSVGKVPFAAAPIKPVEPSSPPSVMQQNSAPPPPDAPRGNNETDDRDVSPVRVVNTPLLTREVSDDALGVFERRTLFFARCGFYVGICTLLVIVATAVVFWDQFREMAAQTNILAISARQARRDSAESSIASQKQLGIAQQQANASQDSVKALQEQVALVRSNFAKEQRPIVICAIIKPYLEAQTKIRADIFWGNYGKSVALKAKGRGRIFWGESALKDAYQWFEGEAKNPYPKGMGGIIIPPGVPASENPPDAHRSTLFSDGTITKPELDWIVANDFSAVIVSRQDYFDQLGNHYWTEGCWSHFATGAIPQCPQHNQVH